MEAPFRHYSSKMDRCMAQYITKELAETPEGQNTNHCSSSLARLLDSLDSLDCLELYKISVMLRTFLQESDGGTETNRGQLKVNTTSCHQV